MLLRSLTIKNYRSLEDVRLEKLGQFNVLIGRNNSGKSSVFGILQELNATLGGGGSVPDRVLTDSDLNRSLEVTLTFEPRQEDREEFVDLVATTDAQRARREELLASPLLRRVEFFFKAPRGRSQLLHLRETRLWSEDNLWAVSQRMISDENNGDPESRIVHLDEYGGRFNAFYLNRGMLDLGEVERTQNPLTTGLAMRSVMQQYAAGSQVAYPAATWAQRRLVRYLSDAFFFEPYRHSVESAAAQQMPQLDQTGSILPQGTAHDQQ